MQVHETWKINSIDRVQNEKQRWPSHLDYVVSEKELGVIMDASLTFRENILEDSNFPDGMLLAVRRWQRWWTPRDLSSWFSIGPPAAAVLGICSICEN